MQEGVCGICHTPLDAGRWMQVDLPCGHRYHFVCLRPSPRSPKVADAPAICKTYDGDALSRNDAHDFVAMNVGGTTRSPIACSICEELIYSKPAGLIAVTAECSDRLQRFSPTDVEFWRSTELKLGRSVKCVHNVPASLLCLRGLRCLDFTAHPVTYLPPEITAFQSLKRLVLVSCHITELPEDVGNLDALEQLFVTGCCIRRLPASVSRLKRLWEFYFDGNQLEELPEELPPRMDNLKVSGNRLRSLPKDFTQCKNLKSLRAYGNLLTRVPALYCMSQLVDVLLQGNRLRSLPQDIGCATTFRTLLIHDNELEYLPDSICHLAELRWLYVYNNRLQHLPSDMLTHLSKLERLLVEANPLSQEASGELLSYVPWHVRVLGVDAVQVEGFYDHCDQASKVAPPLSSKVISGWMLPWGRLYAKLAPASQLRRSECTRAVSSKAPVYGGDVLVVAFAASQGEPEWFGVLGQLLGQNNMMEIDRYSGASFWDVHTAVHGVPPTGRDQVAARRATAAMWLHPSEPSDFMDEASGCKSPQDFDVLSLCDTNAQWYVDTDVQHLGVEAKLTSIISRYRRVMMIGTSMGGFGALSHAHLADTVAVFGPQTDLCMSHLRPGMGPAELTAASTRMRDNVHCALQKGTRIEYHVAMEDHLLYARVLPLPPGSLVVHPFDGRVARVLERAGVLGALLAGLIAELQTDGQSTHPVPVSVAFAEAVTLVQQALEAVGVKEQAQSCAWDWAGTLEQVQVAKWDTDKKMSFVWVTGQQLSLLCTDPARVGDWFCSQTGCWSRNEEKAGVCHRCRREQGFAQKVLCSRSSSGAAYTGGGSAASQHHRYYNNGNSRHSSWEVHRCPCCGMKALPQDGRCRNCRARVTLKWCKGCAQSRPCQFNSGWYCSECSQLRAHRKSSEQVQPRQLLSWSTLLETLQFFQYRRVAALLSNGFSQSSTPQDVRHRRTLLILLVACSLTAVAGLLRRRRSFFIK